eukprot:scaffold1534_cov267-Pinguiococcus_pyrenoidosus.AAC.10
MKNWEEHQIPLRGIQSVSTNGAPPVRVSDASLASAIGGISRACQAILTGGAVHFASAMRGCRVIPLYFRRRSFIDVTRRVRGADPGWRLVRPHALPLVGVIGSAVLLKFLEG